MLTKLFYTELKKHDIYHTYPFILIFLLFLNLKIFNNQNLTLCALNVKKSINISQKFTF